MIENKEKRIYLFRNFQCEYSPKHDWRNNITLIGCGINLDLSIKKDKLIIDKTTEIKADFKKWNCLDIFIENDYLNIDLNNSRVFSMSVPKNAFC